MRNCDYIAQRIKQETDTVFGVTGGCIVNQVDAFHKAGLKIVPMHHEQAAAMAADAYSRVTGKLGVCFATSGPGGQNLLTGLSCAYYDSVSVLAIVGQVPRKHIKHGNVRQYGFQESDNRLTMGSTGMCATRVCSNLVFEELDWVIAAAKSYRKTVSIVEVCDDVQRELFIGVESNAVKQINAIYPIEHYVERVISRMRSAKKPVLILGAGCQSDRINARQFVEWLKWPTFLTWGALDLLEHEHILNYGRFGICGPVSANKMLRESDMILAIGTRLDTHCIAEDEEIIKKTTIVDIDGSEVEKCRYGGAMVADASLFMQAVITAGKTIGKPTAEWLCRLEKIRLENPEPKSDAREIITRLSDLAPENAIIVSDAGQTVSWTFQGWKVKRGQRLFTAFNHSPMGYALPAAIGAKYACPDRPVICITGDGGLMMNVQELYNIVPNNLNIQIYMMNNCGYGMIRQTQNTWPTLDKAIATDYKTGLHFPQYDKLCASARIRYRQVFGMEGLMIESGTTLHDIKIDYNEEIVPKLKFGCKFDEL